MGQKRATQLLAGILYYDVFIILKEFPGTKSELAQLLAGTLTLIY